MHDYRFCNCGKINHSVGEILDGHCAKCGGRVIQNKNCAEERNA